MLKKSRLIDYLYNTDSYLIFSMFNRIKLYTNELTDSEIKEKLISLNEEHKKLFSRWQAILHAKIIKG